jgi:BirA family transcriptional regulator, biotin operon repressor / biotin---[acetyl-CoA-carboxylase] ligase
LLRLQAIFALENLSNSFDSLPQTTFKLMPNTLFIGKVLRCFDELPSTNDYMKMLIAESNSEPAAKSRPPEGMVVRAVSQSAGRGQFGSRWESAPGDNLTFSAVLYPLWLPVSNQFLLSQAVALAVRETVAGLLPGRPDIRIKWPNDIYIGGLKTAGILIENVLSGGKYAAAIAGIGLNVNQTVFPAQLPNPGSLALESGQSFDPGQVLDALLENLERRYLQLRGGHFAEIRADYLHNLYRRGENTRFERADGSVFSGVLRDVSTSGHLLVDTAAGTEEFELKAIRLL